MKKTFSFCLFCFISVLLGMAQSDLKQAIIQKGKNNSIREEYFIRQDSVKEGPYKYYYKNTLLHEGSYAEGKRHGLWRFYNGSGDLTFEGTFANDLKNGKWLYYNKGKIKAEQYFTNNQKDSTWIKNYPSGKPEYIINYRNNTKNGETRLFHENGQVSLHCNYVNGVLEGDYLKYYNNAQLLESSHYKEGNLNGNCKVYYRNGNLFLEVFFDEGRLLNIVQQNDFNGKNIDLKDFRDGNGVYKAYYLPDSGEAELKISSIANFKDGYRMGKYISYYKNGNIKRKGSYVNGCEQGKWKIYKEEGGLKSKVNFNFKHERKCKYSSFYNIEKETTILGDIYAYSLLEEKPEFPGGSPALQAFIAENTGYPVNSQLDRVCGQVIVSFVINTFGEVTSPKIYSGINEELDNEALRVISIMPRWTPGFRDATPVNVQIQVPFTFNIYK